MRELVNIMLSLIAVTVSSFCLGLQFGLHYGYEQGCAHQKLLEESARRLEPAPHRIEIVPWGGFKLENQWGTERRRLKLPPKGWLQPEADEGKLGSCCMFGEWAADRWPKDSRP